VPSAEAALGHPWPWDVPSLSPSQHGVPQPHSPLLLSRMHSPPTSPTARGLPRTASSHLGAATASATETPEAKRRPESPTDGGAAYPVTPAASTNTTLAAALAPTGAEIQPSPAASWLSLSVSVPPSTERNFPVIRQAIIAKIDALVNIGFSPKLTHSRVCKWPSAEVDRAGLSEVETKETAMLVLGQLLPMVEHKGLETGVLRCVMELLCAACVLAGPTNLGECLPRVTTSMINRLGGEGVLSKVEKEFAPLPAVSGDYNLLANDTGDTSLEGKAVDEDDDEEDVAMSSMEEDDWDDWDDEADVFNEDALVSEFGRYLEGLCANFPQLRGAADGISQASTAAASGAAGAEGAALPAPLNCRRTSMPSGNWPGVSDESARVLNWLVDKHSRGI